MCPLIVLPSGQPVEGDGIQKTLQSYKETLRQPGVVLKQTFILELGDCVWILGFVFGDPRGAGATENEDNQSQGCNFKE